MKGQSSRTKQHVNEVQTSDSQKISRSPTFQDLQELMSRSSDDVAVSGRSINADKMFKSPSSSASSEQISQDEMETPVKRPVPRMPDGQLAIRRKPQARVHHPKENSLREIFLKQRYLEGQTHGGLLKKILDDHKKEHSKTVEFVDLCLALKPLLKATHYYISDSTLELKKNKMFCSLEQRKQEELCNIIVELRKNRQLEPDCANPKECRGDNFFTILSRPSSLKITDIAQEWQNLESLLFGDKETPPINQAIAGRATIIIENINTLRVLNEQLVEKLAEKDPSKQQSAMPGRK